MIALFGPPSFTRPNRLVYDLVLWPAHQFVWAISEWGDAAALGVRLRDPAALLPVSVTVEGARAMFRLWHHIEHGLLQGQYLLGYNLFGQPVPTSILQLWAPRVELHLFYNTIVFIPMVIAMYHHIFPPPVGAGKRKCTCAWHGQFEPVA